MTDYYSKIDTLYNRDKKTHKVTQELRCPEFDLIKEWVLETKLDGMNLSIVVTTEIEQHHILTASGENGLQLRGRTPNAQIPKEITAWFDSWLYNNTDRIDTWMEAYDLHIAELFMEGVGSKINGGGDYGDHHGILFDVKVHSWDKNKWNVAWLDPSQVTQVSKELNLERAHILDIQHSLEAIEHLVRKGIVDPHRNITAEGIVAKPPVPLYNRQGKRVMFKLKTKDF